MSVIASLLCAPFDWLSEFCNPHDDYVTTRDHRRARLHRDWLDDFVEWLIPL